MGRWRHVDPGSDRPVFKQIADMLRADIEVGTLRHGEWLPSEAHLCEEFNAGRNSVRSALVFLAAKDSSPPRPARAIASASEPNAPW